MGKPLLAGNWKMYGSTESVSSLVKGILSEAGEFVSVALLVCPSFTHLTQVKEMLTGSNMALGAQNLSEFEEGAYTGEVSPAMVKAAGCDYVIVGHSERRALFHEDDAMVARKVLAAQHIGLIPIVCVGETLEQREQGATLDIIRAQLEAVLKTKGINYQQLVVAYEPVWAIGTGQTATPEQAQEVHAYIRKIVAQVDAQASEDLSILYGGSVKPDNADELFAQQDIDGGLVGGASLNAEHFLSIAKSLQQRRGV